MKKFILLISFIIFVSNLFGQIRKYQDILSIEILEIYEDSEKYNVEGKIYLTLEKKIPGNIEIFKNQFLYPINDTFQVLILCDILDDNIGLENKDGNKWTAPFSNLELGRDNYFIKFKAVCTEKGLSLPEKEYLGYYFTSNISPKQNICSSNQTCQIDYDNNRIKKKENFTFEGNEDWETTLKALIDDIMRSSISTQLNTNKWEKLKKRFTYDLDNFMDNGIINQDLNEIAIYENDNENPTFYIKFSSITPDEQSENKFTYKNITFYTFYKKKK